MAWVKLSAHFVRVELEKVAEKTTFLCTLYVWNHTQEFTYFTYSLYVCCTDY